MSIISFLKRYSNDAQGATAIEYGLLVAGISLALAAGLAVFSDTFAGFLDAASTVFDRFINR